MSVEEKIKRAEEIYNRRNGSNYYSYSPKKKSKKAPSLTHRMIKQIIMCMLIYSVFYVTANREYLLSYEFQTKVQEIASKNEFLNNTYNSIMEYAEKYFNYTVKKPEEQNKNEENNEINKEESKKEQQSIENNNENIGGAFDEIPKDEPKSQEEIDIEEIKNTTTFITPVNGTISSTFGWRTPTTLTVPKYHTGLDIAAPTGTIIKSATEGIVTLASSEGDYGKHYKIQIGNITIIYAHCSKLYLKEGDNVYQGQEIAEVGSTGNSTGPHLHFEIRKEDRLIDPQLLLNL